MTKNKNVVTEDTAAADTLHPKAGSEGDGHDSSGGGGLGDVCPSRMDALAKIFGAFASIDKESLVKYYNGMISTSKDHFSQDKATVETNRASIKAHPSDAVGKGVKEEIKKELDSLLGEEFSAEFKDKATTVFESALNLRVSAELIELEDKYEKSLNEACEEIHGMVMEKVETYLEFVADKWLKENEVAVESALRSEITKEFMSDLRNLFIEHNINIPEEQVDVVDELASKVEELNKSLADAIEENAGLRSFKEVADRKNIVASVAEGLTTVDREKLLTLVEGVEAETNEEFEKKVKTLRESVRPATKKTENKVESLMEEVSEENKPEEQKVFTDVRQRSYVNAIDRIHRKS